MAAVVIAMVVGCGTEPALPTCAELGCGVAASGDPVEWSPCKDDTCWCSLPPHGYTTAPAPVACSRVPCSAVAPLCPSGRHDQHAAYYDPYPVLGDVCFCVPD